jgi:hypothetical protein
MGTFKLRKFSVVYSYNVFGNASFRWMGPCFVPSCKRQACATADWAYLLTWTFRLLWGSSSAWIVATWMILMVPVACLSHGTWSRDENCR